MPKRCVMISTISRGSPLTISMPLKYSKMFRCSLVKSTLTSIHGRKPGHNLVVVRPYAGRNRDRPCDVRQADLLDARSGLDLLRAEQVALEVVSPGFASRHRGFCGIGELNPDRYRHALK